MNYREYRGCGFGAGLLLLAGLFLLGGVPRMSAQAGVLPAATPSSGPAVAQFAGKRINMTAPPGTIEQIDLPLSRGAYPGCLSIPEAPALNYYNDNLELTDIAIISTCGWQADETVKVTVMDPLGKFTSSEVRAAPAPLKNDVYQVDVFFQPGVDALPGKYRFTLQGSAVVKAKITYVRPTKARLYVLTGDRFRPNFSAQGGKERIRLHGFLPNEPVRLLAYRVEGTLNRFFGWQDFTTDPRGQLIIETDIPKSNGNSGMNYYAYGRETHFVSLERFSPQGTNITRRFDMELYCPGAQAPRLNGPAAIRPVGAVSLDIHQQPGFGSRLIAQAAADTPLRTFGYPKCIDRAFWWQVSTGKPMRFGWVAESFLGKYLVEAAE